MARRLALAAGLSLLLNLFFLLRLDLSWLDQATAPRRAVSMSPLTARDWEQNRAVAGQTKPPQVQRLPAPPPVPPPPDQAKGQVVRVAPPREPPKEPPKDARFLAEHDSAVEKETRSRLAANGLGRPAPVPTSPLKPEPLRGPRGQADAGEQPKAESKPPEPPRKLAFDWRPGKALRQEALRRPEQPEEAPAPAPAPSRPGEKGLPGADGTTLPPELRPSAAAYQALAGGPAADHLPDVEEGDATFLNTREWRYAGYFNLITERVDEQWVTTGRREVEQRDPSGQRFLYKDRLAVLDVTLDDHGSVRNVRVVRSTGVDFLDRVAMDMFRRAETFANPPKGIIDARGQINFAFGINFIGVSPSMGLMRRPAFRE